MLYVARRSRPRTTWRHANATFVATRRLWVGPGVNMDWKSSVIKADMAVRFESVLAVDMAQVVEWSCADVEETSV